MLIDWFTLIAQILNFVVLIWLLKRFLYKPILDAIDARQKKNAETQAEAMKKIHDADAERLALQRKNAAFDAERGQRLQTLNEEVEMLRRQLLADVKAEVEASRGHWIETLEREKTSICKDMQMKVQEEILSTTRRIVEDFAGVKLEEYTIEIFLQRLKKMLEKKDPTLAHFLQPTPALQVTTTFPLSETSHAAVVSTVQKHFGKEVAVNFAVSPGLVAGIELMASGQKVCWNMGEYLSSFEHHMGDVLVNKARKIHA